LSKAALVCSDWVVAVSPAYAQEIQTLDGGSGLHEVLRGKANVNRLTGILNGIDSTWDPSSDEFLVCNYGLDDFQKVKRVCKTALQRELGLQINADAALLGFVGRLTWQKGIDILGEVVEWLMSEAAHHYQFEGQVQLIMMGVGEEEHTKMLSWAQRSFPGRVCGYIGFDPAVEHRMMAGCDLMIMPSRYEPCGLPQMQAQAYGTLPVVTATGGLLDSVAGSLGSAFNEAWTDHELPTGFFLPKPPSADGLRLALARALKLFYRNRWQGASSAFQRMQRKAMLQSPSFRWQRAIVEYDSCFEAMLNAPHAHSSGKSS